MRYKQCDLIHFGKFNDQSLEFSPGLNLVCGDNESGKTTLHAFLKAMIFGLRRGRGRASRNDAYSRYKPWDQPATYAGRLVFESGGKDFRLTRDFAGGNEDLTCLTDGEKMSVRDGDLDMLCGEISEAVYDNTISIGQLSGVNEEALKAMLKNYMTGQSALSYFPGEEKQNDPEEISRTNDFETARGNLRARKREIENSIRQEQKEAATRLEAARMRVQHSQENVHRLKKELGQLEQASAEARMRTGQSSAKARIEQSSAKARVEQSSAEARMRTGQSSADSSARRGQTSPESSVGIDSSAQSRQSSSGPERSQSLQATVSKEREVQASTFPAAGLLVWAVCLFSIIFMQLLPGARLVLAVLALVSAIGGFLLTANYFRRQRQWTEMQRDIAIQRNKNEEDKDLENESEDWKIRDGQISDYLTEEEEKNKEKEEEKEKLKKLGWNIEYARKELQREEIQLSNEVTAYEELQNETQISRKSGQKLAAIKLALDTLEEIAGKMQKKNSARLIGRASEILKHITGGKYAGLQVDEALSIYLRQQEDGETRAVPFGLVSRGSQEQTCFALRMAAAEVLCEEEFPILLDETFAFWDQNRLSAVLQWLAEQDRQIILFTCRRTEKEELERLNRASFHVPYSLHQL